MRDRRKLVTDDDDQVEVYEGPSDASGPENYEGRQDDVGEDD